MGQENARLAKVNEGLQRQLKVEKDKLEELRGEKRRCKTKIAASKKVLREKQSDCWKA